MTAAHGKGVDPIKMLAFERLMEQKLPPLAIRERLKLASSTYYRYLRRYRRAGAAR